MTSHVLRLDVFPAPPEAVSDCRTVGTFSRRSFAALAAASLRINGPIRYAQLSTRVSAPHSASSVTSLWVVDAARPVRLLISSSLIAGRSSENAPRMVITRAVTVRGVLSRRPPDTVHSLSEYAASALDRPWPRTHRLLGQDSGSR